MSCIEERSAPVGLWRVWFTSRALASVSDSASWVESASIREKSPFIIGPDGTFDERLNSFFATFGMIKKSLNTQEAYARDLARFLNFLHCSRSGLGADGPAPGAIWTTATTTDRAAYFQWRNEDQDGPRVTASSWNREVATVYNFYKWAVSKAFVAKTPFEENESKSTYGFSRRSALKMSAAEFRRDSSAPSMAWLPAADFTRWRDVGLRGMTIFGLRDPNFRGLMAGRNSAFADLMVRTGMRLTEQSALLLPEIPGREAEVAFAKFWLPGRIVKGSKARTIYIPEVVLSSIDSYIRGERCEVVRRAIDRGLYEGREDWIMMKAGDGRKVVMPSGLVQSVSKLDSEERQRVLMVHGGLRQPASLWLTDEGMPMSASTWQGIFAEANERCARNGVRLRCHPHALRHSYAVATLDKLQRAHIAALGSQNEDQRRRIVQVFGDPLDWLRKRLGHSSIESTQKYLHTLSDLEFETKLALIGNDDEWDVPYTAEMQPEKPAEEPMDEPWSREVA